MIVQLIQKSDHIMGINDVNLYDRLFKSKEID